MCRCATVVSGIALIRFVTRRLTRRSSRTESSTNASTTFPVADAISLWKSTSISRYASGSSSSSAIRSTASRIRSSCLSVAISAARAAISGSSSIRRSCRSPSVFRTPSGSSLSSSSSGSRWFHSATGRISIRRPWRTLTRPRAASAPITSRAVVFEAPNSSQMSCSVGGSSARPMSPFTLLPARTRVTWSLSLSDWTRAVVIVAKVVWSSCDLTADRTPLVRECQDPPRFEGDAVTRPIHLAEVGMPPLDVPETVPHVAAAEFEARIAALLAAVDVDQVVVYGDREHLASLVFLCNLDPRFEEVVLVLGRGRRTLLVGKEDVGYVPIVPIELDVILCPTLSLMGIDRSGGPTVEQALREAGIR